MCVCVHACVLVCLCVSGWKVVVVSHLPLTAQDSDSPDIFSMTGGLHSSLENSVYVIETLQGVTSFKE